MDAGHVIKMIKEICYYFLNT